MNNAASPRTVLLTALALLVPFLADWCIGSLAPGSPSSPNATVPVEAPEAGAESTTRSRDLAKAEPVQRHETERGLPPSTALKVYVAFLALLPSCLVAARWTRLWIRTRSTSRDRHHLRPQLSIVGIIAGLGAYAACSFVSPELHRPAWLHGVEVLAVTSMVLGHTTHVAAQVLDQLRRLRHMAARDLAALAGILRG